MTVRRTTAVLAASGFLVSGLVGCSGNSAGQSGTQTQPTVIRVGVAASMVDVIDKLAVNFQQIHPQAKIEPTSASSAVLVTQIEAGAPLDVLITAGAQVMGQAVDRRLVTAPRAFASNSLEVAIPAANPGQLTGWRDVARPSISVARCAAGPPCGTTTDQLLTQNTLTIQVSSLDVDVRAVLTRVRTEQVDAGIVYVTDVLAAGGSVRGLAIPAVHNVSTTYQAAVVAGSAHGDIAAQFVDYLTTASAAEILQRAGFGPA